MSMTLCTYAGKPMILPKLRKTRNERSVESDCNDATCAGVTCDRITRKSPA